MKVVLEVHARVPAATPQIRAHPPTRVRTRTPRGLARAHAHAPTTVRVREAGPLTVQ